jgi:hypothetical protein
MSGARRRMLRLPSRSIFHPPACGAHREVGAALRRQTEEAPLYQACRNSWQRGAVKAEAPTCRRSIANRMEASTARADGLNRSGLGTSGSPRGELRCLRLRRSYRGFAGTPSPTRLLDQHPGRPSPCDLSLIIQGRFWFLPTSSAVPSSSSPEMGQKRLG